MLTKSKTYFLTDSFTSEACILNSAGMSWTSSLIILCLPRSSLPLTLKINDVFYKDKNFFTFSKWWFQFLNPFQGSMDGDFWGQAKSGWVFQQSAWVTTRKTEIREFFQNFSALYKPIRSPADMRRPWKCYRRAQNRFEWYQAEFDRCSVGGGGLLLGILNGLKRNGWNDWGRAEFRMMNRTIIPIRRLTNVRGALFVCDMQERMSDLVER